MISKNNSFSLDEAKKKLEGYCSYQERCHKEVHQKLAELNMIPLAREEIVFHLIKHNFLNEERFAKSFARGKFRIKKWGKIRITRELKFRNITAYNIKIALAEIDVDDYFTTFEMLAEKKCATIIEANMYKKRKKLADYLLYRGWEPDLVYKKITALIK